MSAPVPTVPQRRNPGDLDNGDNWVDLEELYRWLQELEDPTLKEFNEQDEESSSGKHENANFLCFRKRS